MKKIAILTSGGDAPGMNVAIKAVINASINNNIEPYLVYEGYKGLTEGNFVKATKKMVQGIDKMGGTMIFSSRFPEFKNVNTRKIAVDNLKKSGIDSLVVIGGDGSYQGASKLSDMGIKTISLPGTIDNDISLTNFTIGFDTALATIVETIDKLQDTIYSHDRIMVVETMGRHCGDLAIHAAIATGAHVLSVPERKLSTQEIINQVTKLKNEGVRGIIVLVTEYMYDVSSLAHDIEAKVGKETKHIIIGHTQRGGKPTSFERSLATRMGAFAVEQLLHGKTNVAISVKNDTLVLEKISSVIESKRKNPTDLLKLYDLIK